MPPSPTNYVHISAMVIDHVPVTFQELGQQQRRSVRSSPDEVILIKNVRLVKLNMPEGVLMQVSRRTTNRVPHTSVLETSETLMSEPEMDPNMTERSPNFTPRGNKFGERGARYCAIAINNNATLRELNIANNRIQDEGAGLIGKALGTFV
ncbi:hypothetical protein RRG08_035508 [Elysia crispata]|uniref:Uncharacterized protein n=1 Tax=Elysia crispata TaxID=231223 RepID=A0AAE1A613_9GAST|nr:hypothetical protein RRG08_035508 [Elysia crispata]